MSRAHQWRLRGSLALALAALLLCWAAAPAAAAPPLARPMPEDLPEDPFAGLAERFEQMARTDEARKEWHQALMRWEAVAAMDSQHREARTRIREIRRRLDKEADKHFALAQAALKKKQYGKAFREFLRTLSYDPERHLALAMVKHDLNARSVNEYTVQTGDSSRRIAQSVYDDADFAFLVRYFNDIRSDRDLRAGQTLRLPVIAGVNVAVSAPRRGTKAPPPARVAKQEARTPSRKESAPAKATAKPEAPRRAPEPEAPAVAAVGPEAPVAPALSIVAAEVQQPEPAQNIYSADVSDAQLAKAQEQFDAGKYDQAANTAENLLDEDPANSGARELLNAAYYSEGKRQAQRGNAVAAMQMYSRVEDDYRDVNQQRAALNRNLADQQADVHYIAGVTAFLNENLEQAIQEWELTLKLEPNHPQAAKDLENARALRARLAQVN